jgi:hypothetical protein
VPTQEAIKRVAREMLGATSWGGFREYRWLADLLAPEERIDAMAVCRLRGAGAMTSQRLVVATPVRLLLLQKAIVSGRERMREIPVAAVQRVATSPPGRLDLVVGDELLELSLVHPARQLAVLACLIGSRIDPTRAGAGSCDALFDLARDRLGSAGYVVVEPSLVALAVDLAADEVVVELARSKTALVAATADRLVIVPNGKLRPGAAVACRYEEITGADGTDDGGIVIRGPGGRRQLGPLQPPGSAELLLWEIRSRARV